MKIVQFDLCELYSLRVFDSPIINTMINAEE